MSLAEAVVALLLGVLIIQTGASTSDDAFLSSCKKYFYKDVSPTGFPASSELKYICQRYDGKFYFATFYNISNRIPLYSAYKVEETACSGSQPSRRDDWFIEPELAGKSKPADMETDKKSNRDWVMPVQAINDDYRETGFDRGHLNPNFMHCGSARTATFSLTNSVPQDPCFNRIVWFGLERDTMDKFSKECNFTNANRHVITGAVPSKDNLIPNKDEVVEDDPNKATERVNVPTHSWTLACCDASEATGGHSSYFHGAIGGNEAGGTVEKFTNVEDMEKRLSALYGFGTQIKLLTDGCQPAQMNSTMTKDVFG